MGGMLGEFVGSGLGDSLGLVVREDGIAVGAFDGSSDGIRVGTVEGELVGCVGALVGASEGASVGCVVGASAGCVVGASVGWVGALEGVFVGAPVGKGTPYLLFDAHMLLLSQTSVVEGFPPIALNETNFVRCRLAPNETNHLSNIAAYSLLSLPSTN